MAKIFTFVLATQIISNGLWYCTTQQSSIKETPLVVLPVAAGVFVAYNLFIWVCSNWEGK